MLMRGKFEKVGTLMLELSSQERSHEIWLDDCILTSKALHIGQSGCDRVVDALSLVSRNWSFHQSCIVSRAPQAPAKYHIFDSSDTGRAICATR